MHPEVKSENGQNLNADISASFVSYVELFMEKVCESDAYIFPKTSKGPLDKVPLFFYLEVK